MYFIEMTLAVNHGNKLFFIVIVIVSKLTIIGSDNGLSPIIWTNAGTLSLDPGEQFSMKF